MITTCTGCQTSYRLDDRKVPRRLIRVRCPRCEAIFRLDGTAAGAEPAPLEIERPRADVGPGAGGSILGPTGGGAAHLDPERFAPAPAAAPADDGIRAGADDEEASDTGGGFTHGFEGGFEAAPAPGPEPAAEAGPEPDGGSGFGSGFESGFESGLESRSRREPEPEPEPVMVAAGRPERRSRDKAALLARALVSDILVYNREARDDALREGNLLEALGPEIKKSWELYKERVTPEVANGTTHFRDALNEILAEGQKLF